ATFFYVAPDLQGSRYLYLPAVGWATLLVAVATAGRGAQSGTTIVRTTALTMVAILAVGFAIGVRRHLQHWTRAAAERERVEASAAANRDMQACSAIAVSGLPDVEQGAYVFRNGAPEAFRNDLGLI